MSRYCASREAEDLPFFSCSNHNLDHSAQLSMDTLGCMLGNSKIKQTFVCEKILSPVDKGKNLVLQNPFLTIFPF